MAPRTGRPTSRQNEYLAFIHAYTALRGVPPSLTDIGDHFRTTPPSVCSMIRTLEARGFITRVPGAPRTVRVMVPLDAPSEASSAAEVKAAVRLGTMVIERLVPAMRSLDRHQLYACLDAVASAVAATCSAAGATSRQLADAQQTLRRVALVTQGMAPEADAGEMRRP